jgi:hypothetical protein
MDKPAMAKMASNAKKKFSLAACRNLSGKIGSVE